MSKKKQKKHLNVPPFLNAKKTETVTASEEVRPKSKDGTTGKRGKLFYPETKKSLWIHIALLLLIPYAFLWLCGLIFDQLLRWYFMTTYIFFALCALYIAAIVLIVLSVKRYRRRSR